jgi:N6-adenosine-specific RNA methylase IME4
MLTPQETVLALQTQLGLFSKANGCSNAELPAGPFSVILADPPWPFVAWSAKGQGRSASRHYHVEEIETIKALPVATHATRDCWLFLWCTSPHNPWLEEVMNAWGFTFSGKAFCWVKTTKLAHVTSLSVTAAPCAKSPWHTGMGFTTRANSEDCWLGRRGKPSRLDKGVHELIVAPVREHSRKPDETYARIERFCAGPYLELYARQQYPGWICVGDESAKFPVEAACMRISRLSFLATGSSMVVC